ncbi:MAG: polyphosphate kinase [Pseudomonadota bacterium]
MSKIKRVRTAPTADCIVPEVSEYDLDAPELYLNRELTWLSFNWRVLEEAKDIRNPLLERWRYLVIVGSNLDEFTMKRIGGLQLTHESNPNSATVDGRSPLEQIYECNLETELMRSQWRELFDELNKALRLRGIGLVHHKTLSKPQANWLREHYLENIFPLITPQATGPAHSFPFISNLSINLLVTVIADGKPSYIRITAPIGSDVPSVVRIDKSDFFVPIEEIIAANLDLLFPDHCVARCDSFRVIRNANTGRDVDEVKDLVAVIESELKNRQFADAVQLEVSRGMPQGLRRMLARELNLLDKSSVIEVLSPLFRNGFMRLHDCFAPKLKYKPHIPVTPKVIGRSIVASIRENGSLLVHHPYDSFETTVLAFLKEAAQDPQVKAIKMSLYRTDRESRIIGYLAEAARNGKQVAVAVELKARFDEAANIRWARRLEQEGIHVTYGVLGLKTHCKTILVVRMDRESSPIARRPLIADGHRCR